MPPRGVEILALGDVELAVPRPIADGAFVAQRQAGDHGERAVLGHVLAVAADDDRDLAFVVELLGDFRPHQILPRSDQRIRRAIEHARIFRSVGDVIVRPAVGVVDADAEDFFRRRERRQQLDFVKRHVGAHPGGGRRRLVEGLRAKHLAQRLEAVQPRAQIDDALAGDRAETRPAAQGVTGKAHVVAPFRCSRNVLEVRTLSVNGHLCPSARLLGIYPPRAARARPRCTANCSPLECLPLAARDSLSPRAGRGWGEGASTHAWRKGDEDKSSQAASQKRDHRRT